MRAGGTVVVPSRQRAEAVRLAYAAIALKQSIPVWRTPDVLPFETWRAREVARAISMERAAPRLLSPAEEWWLWRQASETLTDGLELLRHSMLADALRSADQLSFEHGLDVRTLSAHGPEPALLARASALVRKHETLLQAGGSARLAAHLQVLGDSRALLFAGFASLTPALRTLIEARRAQGLETHTDEPRCEAAKSRSPRFLAADDSADEFEQIAAWARAHLARQGDARLLIVLPGAAAPRERLVTLLQQSLDAAGFMRGDGSANVWVGLEGGSPLNIRPLVAHALTSLRFLDAGADFASLSEWLRAPYFKIGSSARARLDAWLREHAGTDADVRTLRALLAKVPRSLEGAARQLSDSIEQAHAKLGGAAAAPREWSERAHAALDALGWPGERALGSDEQQTVNRLLELLKELGGLGSVAQLWSREEALKALTELCARTAFSPASGDVPVTLSPLLADPVVHYDAIWVAGLTADAWPPPLATDAFVPVEMQRKLHMAGATAEGQLREARALMQAWQAAAGELTLSAPRRAGDIELSVSPLLAELQCIAAARIKGGWLAYSLRRAGALESLIDTSGIPLTASTHLPGGTYVLALQNDCPFHAYAQFRLGCEERRPPAPGVQLDIRGRLLHGALERLWRSLRDSHTLLAMDQGACALLIDECVEAAALELWGSEPSSAPQRRERTRATRLILALCALERTRAGFTVRDIERDELLKLAGVELSVRIDRIDSLDAGGLAILDYKSGRWGKSEWYDPRPSHVQLMAYLAAVGGDVRALATVHLTARETRFDGISASAKLLPKVRQVEGEGEGDLWRARRDEWLACLERLVREFANGYAAVDPKPLACRYCPMDSLCRIAESPLPIDDALIESGALNE